MSMFLLINNEDAVIDSVRPQVDYTSPTVTMRDNPGHNLQSQPQAIARPELPDATVGGESGSGNRNGYSTGFLGRSATIQPLSGATIAAPPITNAVQGDVGRNNRSSKLYAGVMDQLTQYTPSQAAYAAAWVGNPAKASK